MWEEEEEEKDEAPPPLLRLDTVNFSAGDLISVIRALKEGGISSQPQDQIGHI